MLKDLENHEQYEDYFNELNNGQNTIFKKIRLYNMAKSQSELIEKEDRIRKYFEDRNYYIIDEIFIINDNIQIAEVTSRSNKEKLFFTYLDYKPLNECGDTFDKALIIILSHKYAQRSDPAYYFAKMIDMNRYTK